MISYTIPKDGASDSTVLVTEINCASGDFVDGGSVLLSYETSKASFEIETEHSGYVYYFKSAGQKCEVGELVAVVSTEELTDQVLEGLSPRTSESPETISGKMVSAKARRLASEHGIDLTTIPDDIITVDVVLQAIERNSFSVDESFAFHDNDIVIYGAGGHAAMCYDIIRSADNFRLVGFIDDNKGKFHNSDLKYFGRRQHLKQLKKQGLKNVVIGIGFLNDLRKRQKVYEELRESFSIPSIVHRSAVIEPSATIAQGCQIMAGAIVGSNAQIQENCIVNSGSIISHDCMIGFSSHITPGAVLAGEVKIGARTTIGMAATVYVGSSVGDDVVVNNGASVFSDVASNSKVGFRE